MPVENVTANRSYPLPAGANKLKDDVLRLIAALNALDVDVATLVAGLVEKAPLINAALTGAPTAPTPDAADNSAKIATTAFVKLYFADFLGSAPEALDTIAELAEALQNNPDIIDELITSIGGKLAKDQNLADLLNVGTALTNLGFSANAKSLIAAANYAAMKLLLAIGVADISDASANGRSLIAAANYAAMFGLLKQAASETATGVVERATSGEVLAGTDISRYVTPKTLQDKFDGAGSNGIAKAWVNFNGVGTVAIRDSFNVSSITDNGTGDYTINFTTALANADYAVFGSASSASPNSGNANVICPRDAAGFNTDWCRIIHKIGSAPTSSADNSIICVQVLGG